MTTTAYNIWEERRELAESPGITLNGNPARISGLLNDFATVTDMITEQSFDWSWSAVKRIVETKGGKFKS